MDDNLINDILTGVANRAARMDEKVEDYSPETRSAIYYEGFADGMREAIKIIRREIIERG